MMDNTILALLAGWFFTVAFVFILKPLAMHLGWVDKPDNLRKRHGAAIPLVGGAAMLLGCAAAVLWVDSCHGQCGHDALLGAMGIMTLVGLWDDRYGLSARFRILLQTGVGYLMALAAGLSMNNFGNIFGFGDVVLPHYVGLLFTVFCVVGAMNAMNMIDGVDGLAGGVTLVALLWMLWLAVSYQMPGVTILLALTGCVMGYLLFNMRHPWRKKASIFMGDAGSMMLGTALVWLLISLTQTPIPQSGGQVIPPVIGLWLVAVPLLDTLSLMVKRRRNGKSPFKADRDHFHHILQDAGFSDRQTTWIIMAFSAVLGGIAVIGWQLGVPEPVLFAGFLLLTAGYYYFIHHSSRLLAVACRLRKRPVPVHAKS